MWPSMVMSRHPCVEAVEIRHVAPAETQKALKPKKGNERCAARREGWYKPSKPRTGARYGSKKVAKGRKRCPNCTHTNGGWFASVWKPFKAQGASHQQVSKIAPRAVVDGGTGRLAARDKTSEQEKPLKGRPSCWTGAL